MGSAVWHRGSCWVRFDVLEIPAAAGEPFLSEMGQRTQLPVSVFEVPRRGWLVLVTAGSGRILELSLYRRQLRLHQRGCWVPLPPTPLAGGPVAWVSRGHIPHSLMAQMSAYQVLRRMESSLA